MHSHADAAVVERLATERVIDFDGVFVIDGDGESAVGDRARARHRGGRLAHDGVAEFVFEAGDEGEARYAKRRAETLENLERRLGRIDVGRRLREHLGQVAAAGERIFEIARERFDQRGSVVGGRLIGADEDVAQMLLDFARVVAARTNPIVLNPQPLDLVGRARHKIHVAADEVGAVVEQRLEHHGGGRTRFPAEKQVGEFDRRKTAALLLRDLPQQFEIEFGGQFGALVFELGQRLGEVFAIGVAVGMAHQDQIARDQSFVSRGIDHRQMAFLFARDEPGFEPALIEVVDDGAGIFKW